MEKSTGPAEAPPGVSVTADPQTRGHVGEGCAGLERLPETSRVPPPGPGVAPTRLAEEDVTSRQDPGTPRGWVSVAGMKREPAHEPRPTGTLQVCPAGGGASAGRTTSAARECRALLSTSLGPRNLEGVTCSKEAVKYCI